MCATDKRLYDIACSFPALQFKGVEKENIPGITATGFYDLDLADYLYKGRGGALSHGEFLIIEALLNLCNPDIHDKFNLGQALYVLDERNLKALLNAIVRSYYRR